MIYLLLLSAVIFCGVVIVIWQASEKKSKLLKQIERFSETNDVSIFGSRRINKVKKALSEFKDSKALKEETAYAGEYVLWYSDEHFLTCDVKKLEKIIFYAIFYALASPKFNQLTA